GPQLVGMARHAAERGLTRAQPVGVLPPIQIIDRVAPHEQRHVGAAAGRQKMRQAQHRVLPLLERRTISHLDDVQNLHRHGITSTLSAVATWSRKSSAAAARRVPATWASGAWVSSASPPRLHRTQSSASPLGAAVWMSAAIQSAGPLAKRLGTTPS